MSRLSRFSLAQRALTGLMSIIAIVFGAIAKERRAKKRSEPERMPEPAGV